MPERFLQFVNLSALKRSNLGGELFQRRANQGQSCQEMSMAIPLHNLARDGRHLQPQVSADTLLHRRRHRGVGTHGPGDHAHPHCFHCRFQPLPVPVELVPPQGQLQPEGQRLSVNPVGAAHH